MTLHSIAQLVLLGWLLGNSARAIEPGGNLRSVWESKFWSRDRGAIGNAGPSAIDSSGGATFTAYKNSSLNLGIYSERHGDVPQLIASQGDAAPGTNEIFAELFQLRTNRSGNVAFFGRLLPDDDVSWKNDHGIWAESSGGGLRLVAREGGTAPGLERGEQLGQLAYVDRPGSSNGGWPESDGQSATLSPFSFNSRGETAYYSRITDENGVYRNNMGIWSEGGGNGPRLVARTGMSAPGFAEGNTFAAFGFRFDGFPLTLNDAGQTAFATRVVGPEVTWHTSAGLWRDDPRRGLELMVRGGDSAPGTGPGVRFVNFDQPLLNNAGDMAFVGYLAGDVTPYQNDTGIWAMHGGELKLVMRSGDQVPGMPVGTVFAPFVFPDIAPPVINAQGKVAFFAAFKVPGVDDASEPSLWGTGLWIDDSEGLHIVARNGELGPDGSSIIGISSFYSNLLMNSNGQVAFGGGRNHSAGDILATDFSGNLHSIVQYGDMIHHVVNDNGLAETYMARSTGLGAYSGGEDGFGSAFNDRGQIAFLADSSVYVSNAVSIPEPKSAVLMLLAVSSMLLCGIRRLAPRGASVDS